MNGTAAPLRLRPAVGGPTLVVAAHGTRDGRDRATIEAVARRVGALRPGLRVQAAFLQFNAPDVQTALVAASGGAVVVPLLLSTGYHLRVDLPEALDAARAGRPGAAYTLAGALGPHSLLVDALIARLRAAGWRGGMPVVLAAAGSSDPAAAEDVQASASALSAVLGVDVVPGYAAGTRPTVADAVAELRAGGAARVAVSSYLISPGQFADVARAAGADIVAAPLADHLALAKLVLRRYDEAVQLHA